MSSYGTIDDFKKIYFGEHNPTKEAEIPKNNAGSKYKTPNIPLPNLYEGHDLRDRDYQAGLDIKEDPSKKYNFNINEYDEYEVPYKVLKALDDYERNVEHARDIAIKL